MLEALRQDSFLEVMDVTTDIEGLSSYISEFKPDVVVITAGVGVPGRPEFDLLWRALIRHPKLQAVMLLDSSTHEYVVEAFRAGAHGIVCWDDGVDALRKCVHAVYLGQVWASSAQLGFLLEVFSRRWAPQTIVDSSGRSLLSKRELDVVRCVSEGLTNREIASRLKLSQHTVKNYLFRTFDKLGVSNRAELILYALNHSVSLRSLERPVSEQSLRGRGARACGSRAESRPESSAKGLDVPSGHSTALRVSSSHWSKGF
ncbi:MAG: response regulator transcription factor [Chloroflexi bacterium]|nr:response regulator transcription factor [Acidobacteriota bacterium]MBV9437472.1 response regulator transcription factor [Acidobacteriota bacterium]MBV9708603.1 response regulator transcription factor [Chloroflexota bacterium]